MKGLFMNLQKKVSPGELGTVCGRADPQVKESPGGRKENNVATVLLYVCFHVYFLADYQKSNHCKVFLSTVV